jgi:hypothetical protein
MARLPSVSVTALYSTSQSNKPRNNEAPNLPHFPNPYYVLPTTHVYRLDYRNLPKMRCTSASNVPRLIIRRDSGGPGFECRQCKISLFATASRPALGTPQAISQEVKRPGRNADHPPHHLVPRSRKEDLYLRSPIRLYA